MLCGVQLMETITAILPGSRWSCLLLRIELQDALSDVVKVYPPMEFKVFVDNITACLEGRNKELSDISDKVLRVMRMEAEEKGSKLPVTEGGKEGKSKVIASCSNVEEKFQHSSNKGEGLADSVGTLGVNLRTRTKQLGAKTEGEDKEEEVRCEVPQSQEKSRFTKIFED